MPSINLDLDYFGHEKTTRLISLLGKGADVLPIRLWVMVGKYYPKDGIIPLTAEEIEMKIGWWGANGRCILALIDVGFMTRISNNTFAVHNWTKHSGHIHKFKIRAEKAAESRWGSKRDATSINDDACSIKPDASSNATSNALAKQSNIDFLNRCEAVVESTDHQAHAPPIPPQPEYVPTEEISNFQKVRQFQCSKIALELGNLWIFEIKRVKRANELDDVCMQFDEWVKIGISSDEIHQEILSKTRDHTEQIWDFKKRIFDKTGKGNSNAGRLSGNYEKNRPSSGQGENRSRVGVTDSLVRKQNERTIRA